MGLRLASILRGEKRRFPDGIQGGLRERSAASFARRRVRGGVVCSGAGGSRGGGGEEAFAGHGGNEEIQDALGEVRRDAVPLHRALPGRALDGGHGRAARPADVLLRRDRRRRLEDVRRRERTGSRSPTRTSRPARSARSPSRNRTRTSSTPAWARRPSGATSPTATASGSPPTRGDLEERGLDRHAADRARSAIHPTNPDIVYVAAFGHVWGAERGPAGHLPLAGRREELEEGPLRGREDGGVGPRRWTRTTRASSTRGSGRSCATRGSSSRGGPGSALYKSTDGGDTWKKLTARRAAGGDLGKDRGRGVRRPRPGAFGRSSRRRARAGSTSSRRRRREVEVRQRRAQDPRARLVLRAGLRRPEERGDRLPAQRRSMHRSTDGGKTFADPAGPARRQPRPLDRSRRPEAR